MNRKLLVYLSILGLLWLVCPDPSEAITIFEDNFDEIALDISKWVTPHSYYCGSLCGITVSNGVISLYIRWIGPASDYASLFPYVNTAYNPFPSDEDWTLTWQMRYSDIGNKGDGFTLYGDAWGSPPIARVWQDSWNGTGLYLWAGNSVTKVWGAPYMGEWTTFSIERSGGQYSTSVNGVFVGATTNPLNPAFFQLGSSIPGDGSRSSWNPVQFDYVRLETRPDPPPSSSAAIPAPEPASFLLLAAGISGMVMGRSILARSKNVI